MRELELIVVLLAWELPAEELEQFAAAEAEELVAVPAAVVVVVVLAVVESGAGLAVEAAALDNQRVVDNRKVVDNAGLVDKKLADCKMLEGKAHEENLAVADSLFVEDMDMDLDKRYWLDVGNNTLDHLHHQVLLVDPIHRTSGDFRGRI